MDSCLVPCLQRSPISGSASSIRTGAKRRRAATVYAFSAATFGTRMLVSQSPFSVETLGGVVRAEILDEGKQVRVEMGKVRFTSKDIPVAGPPRQVLLEDITLDGQSFQVLCRYDWQPSLCGVGGKPDVIQIPVSMGRCCNHSPCFPMALMFSSCVFWIGGISRSKSGSEEPDTPIPQGAAAARQLGWPTSWDYVIPTSRSTCEEAITKFI